MGTNRMMPPANSAAGPNPCTVPGGRSYSCLQGQTVDAPDFDAAILQANGWTHSAAGGVGVTSLRPTGNLKRGTQFHDSTLGYVIVWDGAVWRNPTTGAAV